ncbi:MAG: hypothetical protein AVDCRST_MAG86-1803, partial [uncultured Truepera sp.]
KLKTNTVGCVTSVRCARSAFAAVRWARFTTSPSPGAMAACSVSNTILAASISRRTMAAQSACRSAPLVRSATTRSRLALRVTPTHRRFGSHSRRSPC